MSTLLKNEIKKLNIASVPALGNIGPDIVTLQERLVELGYPVGRVDGVFGQKTAKAVSWLQKDKGLPGSGVIGPKTLNFLSLVVNIISPVSGRESITKDLKGRKDRHLHPTMRMMIEARVFDDHVIPTCFVDRDIQACYAVVMTEIAEMGIHESGGNNRGKEVGYIQGTTGPYSEGGNGDAWCLDLGQCGVAFLEDFFQVESPVLDSAHCMTTLRAAQKIAGLVSDSCEIGTIALAQHGSSDSGHAMPVTKVLKDGKMETSEGNTSFSNIRDGDGSGLKIRFQLRNGDLKTKGFVRIYPFNKVP